MNRISSFVIGGKKVGKIAFGSTCQWSLQLSVSFYTDVEHTDLYTVKVVKFSESIDDSQKPLADLTAETDERRFSEWSKSINNVVRNLSVHPIYINLYDVNYKYLSDGKDIPSLKQEKLPLNSTVVNPQLPKRQYYTVSAFSKTGFEVSPLTADTTISVLDYKNSVDYDCTSCYEYDSQFHDLQIRNVNVVPAGSEVTVTYSTIDGTYELSCPRYKDPGNYPISVKFEGNDINTREDKLELSIGTKGIVSADFTFKNHNEELSTCNESAYYGDVLSAPLLDNSLLFTLSSLFLGWNLDGNSSSIDTKSIALDNISNVIQVSALYKVRDFNVEYYNAALSLVDKQTVRYGLSSVLPLSAVISAHSGYEHAYWTYANGKKIDDAELNFVSNDISAYTCLKMVCKVIAYKTYADKNTVLSTFKYLSGDTVDLSDFISENYSLIAGQYPYFAYVSVDASCLALPLKNKYNTLSVLLGTKFYDYNLFLPAYVLKYKKDGCLCANFRTNYDNDYVKIIEDLKDLYCDFYAEMILKYKNASQAVARFSKVDAVDGTVCVVEDDNCISSYDNSLFRDKTAYILKYRSGTSTASADFKINSNRVYTQAIEDYDMLTFTKQSSSSKFVLTDSNGKNMYEYMTDKVSFWKKYVLGNIASECDKWIKIRAYAVNADLDGCTIETDFNKTGKMQYLTSKYGERILPDSYYDMILKKLTVTLAASPKLNTEEKAKTAAKVEEADSKAAEKTSLKKTVKRRKRKSKEVKEVKNA